MYSNKQFININIPKFVHLSSSLVCSGHGLRVRRGLRPLVAPRHCTPGRTPLTHSLTHSLTHLSSLTHSPSHPPTHSLTHSLIYLHSLTHSLTHLLTHSRTHARTLSHLSIHANIVINTIAITCRLSPPPMAAQWWRSRPLCARRPRGSCAKDSRSLSELNPA